VEKKSVLGKGLASLLPAASQVVKKEEVKEVEKKIEVQLSEETAGKKESTDQWTMGAGTGAVSAGDPQPVVVANKDRHPGISIADVESIQINPFQPRREFDEAALEELSHSILENGIIQPLVVRKNGQHYELIAGERRLRASKIAGLKQVPIVIRKSTDKESLQLALIENIQRQDLNCVDEALAYFQLLQEFSMTQEEVSQQVGKDRASVANALRLLKLPEEVLSDLKSGALTMGHGKALLSLESMTERLEMKKRILEGHLSVRQTESMISEWKENKQSENLPKASGIGNLADEMKRRLKSMSQDLTRFWSTKVVVKGTDKKGKIILHYGSREELDRLVEAMQNKS
tara:strand:+ start:795 stop:1832 length:1038 start_codon:yes stop_codon:yes gene_type:complete